MNFSFLRGTGEIPLTLSYLSDLWDQEKELGDLPGVAGFLPLDLPLLHGKGPTTRPGYMQCVRLLISGEISWQGSTQLLLSESHQRTPLPDLVSLYPLTTVHLLSWHNVHLFSPSFWPTSRYLMDISFFFSSLNAGVIKKCHGLFKKMHWKRFLTLNFSPTPDPHTLVKAVWSLSMAVSQNCSSFLGHLLGNDQNHKVKQLYRPILKLWDFTILFLAFMLLFPH